MPRNCDNPLSAGPPPNNEDLGKSRLQSRVVCNDRDVREGSPALSQRRRAWLSIGRRRQLKGVGHEALAAARAI